MRAWCLVALLVAAGCRGQEGVPVVDDHREAELQVAVDRFVQAGRTPQAYRVFAEAVTSMRARMDSAVARRAELRLVTLAIVPFESVREASISEQASTLGLTVWPSLLGPPLTANEPSSSLPTAGESLEHYVERVCVEVPECARAPVEARVHVLARAAAERALRRTTEAIQQCTDCGDPAWHEIELRWEAVVRSTSLPNEVSGSHK